MLCITCVVLDQVAGWSLQFRWCRDEAFDVGCCQGPCESEPGGAGFVCHGDWIGQGADPVEDLVVVGCQAAFEQFSGVAVEAAGDHRSCVHIQSDTDPKMG